MATKEELDAKRRHDRLKAEREAEENKPTRSKLQKKTDRINKQGARKIKREMGISKEDAQAIFAQQNDARLQQGQQANEQQTRMLADLARRGQLKGGIRESTRNADYDKPSGLDYLAMNPNRRTDGFVNTNMQEAGRTGVAQAKQKQADDRAYAGLALGARGTLDTGDGVNFYNDKDAAKAIFDGGGLPTANTRMMRTPDGGMAMGVESGGLPQLPDDMMLPTGSGLGMSAGQARGKDQIGPGIYAPRNQKDVMSLEANDARKAAAQMQMQAQMKAHYVRQAQQAAQQGRNPEVALDEAVSMGVLTPQDQLDLSQALMETEQAAPYEPMGPPSSLMNPQAKAAATSRALDQAEQERRQTEAQFINYRAPDDYVTDLRNRADQQGRVVPELGLVGGVTNFVDRRFNEDLDKWSNFLFGSDSNRDEAAQERQRQRYTEAILKQQGLK